MHKAPIGIFDSGVGGTSIWKEIHQLLPFENTIYLADSANAPYGAKSREEIVALSVKNTSYLIDKGCKLIVVACNTATTNAINTLRTKFDVPIVGIEPAIKPAALQTQTKSIGILATKGTLSSALFHKTTQKVTQDIVVTEVVGEGLVPLIEKGSLEDSILKKLVHKYLIPMLNANVDYIVLGCSHYPYLIPIIKEMVPPHVKIIDSGQAVAMQTQRVLLKNNILNTSKEKPSLSFISNTNTSTLAQLLGPFSKKSTFVTSNF